MSTKNLREVLEDAAKTYDGTWSVVAEAVRELVAIERAARAFHEDMDPRAMSHAPKAIHDAMDVMTDIAREAK